METTVIELPKPQNPPKRLPNTTWTTDAPVRGTPAHEDDLGRLVTVTQGNVAVSLAPVIGIDQLYPQHEIVKPDLAKALHLLSEAIELLDSALRAFRQSDAITADRQFQQLQFLLVDMFKCRSIGDGYGMIVNTLHLALINRKGLPLNAKQTSTILRVLKELRSRPFVSLESGINAAEELETVGLEPDPPVLAELFVKADE